MRLDCSPAFPQYRRAVCALPSSFPQIDANALPNAKILIHQVSSSFQGQATDIEIHAREIIDIRRKLAAARPDAFLLDLAMSLHNLGIRQSALGRPEAALALAEEALHALWPLFVRLPAAFAVDTGDYLDAVRERLAALGRPHLQRIADFEATRGSRPAPP